MPQVPSEYNCESVELRSKVPKPELLCFFTSFQTAEPEELERQTPFCCGEAGREKRQTQEMLCWCALW